ncbi:MAG: ATP-dependent metallopeptidase HflB, partial [Lachnospiraceae bacterium]|nr:ATP-dependent metallopeptidase HflB [Lachnospiraceae bacterium]
ITYMGGRAAEDVTFGSYTSGAANDIENATNIARAMVTRFGMSERFGMMGLATVESQYLEGRASLNCGEATAAAIDEEVLAIITSSYNKAVELLREHQEVLNKISEYLYEKETLTGKEFMKMFRELTGIQGEEEEKETSEAEVETPDSIFVEEEV